MKFEIKHRLSGSVLFALETESLKLCVEAAVKSGANLRGANLDGANLDGANLYCANLDGANLDGASLYGASLYCANLYCASLYCANLYCASLDDANLDGANLRGANLDDANLDGANLRGASLVRANLRDANLRGANLDDANLDGANLRGASLRGANLRGAKYIVKRMGVEQGNYYWKRFGAGLNNNNFQFKVGLNTLREGEVFAADERVTCSYPGFHFASRSWCAAYYLDRPLEAKIRIPMDAQINEPWDTDGKASADKIEIIQVFDTKTGEDVTDQYR